MTLSKRQCFQPGADPKSYKYFEPKKSGKFKAYCKECGHMVMQGEDECSKCHGTEFTKHAPRQATSMPQISARLKGP